MKKMFGIKTRLLSSWAIRFYLIFNLPSISAYADSGFWPYLSVPTLEHRESSFFFELLKIARSKDTAHGSKELKLDPVELTRKRTAILEDALGSNIVKANLYEEIINNLESGMGQVEGSGGESPLFKGLYKEIKNEIKRHYPEWKKNIARLDSQISKSNDLFELLEVLKDLQKFTSEVQSKKYSLPRYPESMKLFEFCSGSIAYSQKSDPFEKLNSFDAEGFSTRDLSLAFLDKTIQLIFAEGGVEQLQKLYSQHLKYLTPSPLSPEELDGINMLALLENEGILPGTVFTQSSFRFSEFALQEILPYHNSFQALISSIEEDVRILTEAKYFDTAFISQLLNLHLALSHCAQKARLSRDSLQDDNFRKIYRSLVLKRSNTLFDSFKIKPNPENQVQLANGKNILTQTEFLFTRFRDELFSLFVTANPDASISTISDFLRDHLLAELATDAQELSFYSRSVHFFPNYSNQRAIEIGNFIIESVFPFYKQKIAELKPELESDLRPQFNEIDRLDSERYELALRIKDEIDRKQETGHLEIKLKELEEQLERKQKRRNHWALAHHAVEKFSSKPFNNFVSSLVTPNEIFKPVHTEFYKTSLTSNMRTNGFEYHAYFMLFNSEVHDLIFEIPGPKTTPLGVAISTLSGDGAPIRPSLRSYLINGQPAPIPAFILAILDKE